ncbi:MAG: bifunctional hydroxymethylpyrimidine kinase/phosphomethylpyrimidine kinase [Alphaproteobacteria bacterium]|nr:bifunctional hydroxymethylpyrimidine kinase/phosphomethylpyrimidine kinase [Alphaproteobacteria bacterium]
MNELTVTRGRVLVVAGSDSGGGAGIQADIKTITALGGYAATAITALTAQNTQGVQGIFNVPEEFVRQQMELVLDDIGADAIKTGMLARREMIATLAEVLVEKAPGVPLVLDPVMVAKGGAALLEPEAVELLVARLLPLATVVTPNIPEAQILSGMTIRTPEQMREAAQRILALGARAVLLKGGHLDGSIVCDLLLMPEGEKRFTDTRLMTRHTHGTGCTLASAIACGLARGKSLVESVEKARIYLRQAMLLAPGFGKGHGPLNHAWKG